MKKNKNHNFIVVLLIIGLSLGCKIGITRNNITDNTTGYATDINKSSSNDIIRYSSNSGMITEDKSNNAEKIDSISKDNSTKELSVAVTLKSSLTKKEINKFKRFYKLVQKEDGLYDFILLEDAGDVVDEFEFPRKPCVVLYNDHLMEVGVYYGCPGYFSSYYYDIDKQVKSDDYNTPLFIKEDKIFYVDLEGNLVISDIFDKKVYYKKIELDICMQIPPSEAVIKCEYIDDNKLELEYVKGTNRVDKEEIIDLGEYK